MPPITLCLERNEIRKTLLPKNPAKKILILFAHPAQRRSEVNIELAKAAKSLNFVTHVDLLDEYPEYHIDVDREQKRLIEHDIIVFQHPFYWYSTPAILKEWQDLVLEYGFAYGTGGTKLKGKIFFSTLSAGGSHEAYMKDGSNHFTVRQLLAPLEQTANLCGMTYLPPFTLFSSRRAYDEGRIGDHVEAWIETLTALSEGRIDLKSASRLEILNQAKIKPAPTAKKQVSA
jgi:putative NADPH-quinone reductase